MIGSRPRGRRLGAILATALFTIALVPGFATAADTRTLWIGYDLEVDTAAPLGTPDHLGMLKPSKVSVPDKDKGPNYSVFEVEIMNGGGQNLANTVLTVNADFQASARCPAPASATCLDSLKLKTFYDPEPNGTDASTTFCPTPSGDTITCTYGSLPAGAERTLQVVVEVSENYDTAFAGKPLFTANVTTNNENGQNTQSFDATSGPWSGSADPGFSVDAFNPNSLYTFLLSGSQATLSTSGVGTGGNVSTLVNFTTSNRELVTINEGTSTASLYPCPTGLLGRCQPDYSEVTTTSETFGTAPYFKWTLRALVPKTYTTSQGFLVHYPTGANVYDETLGDQYWTLYFKDKSAYCGSNPNIAVIHHCIDSVKYSKFNKDFALLEIVAIMDHQGGTKY